LFLVAFVVAQASTAILVVLAFRALGREMAMAGEELILLYALTAPVLFLLTLLFLRWLDRKDLASLGARWPDGGLPRAGRQALTVPLSVLALLGFWMLLVEVLPASDVRVAGLSPAAGTSAGAFRLLLILAGFLIQGGVEEWVFRGYLYSALKERWSWRVAVFITALAFGLLHGANPNFSAAALLNTCLAGVLLALLVERSGSLWAATLAHGVWNFSVASLASLPVSGLQVFHLLDAAVTGPETLTGGGFGPEGSLLLTALAVPLVAILWPRGDKAPPSGV
jgi:membrane protease YdiL (CAAX protease family)